MTFLRLKRSPLNWAQGVREAHGPTQGQNVLVLGLGASGCNHGPLVCAAAPRSWWPIRAKRPPQLVLLQQELPQVRFVAGPLGCVTGRWQEPACRCTARRA